ncbi:hypothetical protein BB560_002260 [Smittium megazygosporum]|uniref:Uncharacterized protein n=1 Tax=Smittium megazygosporum TaxID=133381 RepID=A0A2T9ZF89_9FUNG|nr:hypothetical protein BB560_002260 [Smittium megazygosporum]
MFDKFWRAVGKRVWVNDYMDSTLRVGKFRKPAPLNNPPYKPAITEASDISNNPYFKRDVRRNYPRVAVYSQQDLAKLLSKPEAEKIASSADGAAATSAEQKSPVIPPQSFNLVSVLSTSGLKPYSSSNLPPTPGTNYKYNISPEQEGEGPGQYYPIYNVY